MGERLCSLSAGPRGQKRRSERGTRSDRKGYVIRGGCSARDHATRHRDQYAAQSAQVHPEHCFHRCRKPREAGSKGSRTTEHFVNDEKTKFDLAIESGNIDVAVKSAQQLDQTLSWQQLAMEAVKHGKIEVVEGAYMKTESWEKLSFLYMLTGNQEKLQKMLRHAEKRGNMMSQFHNSLLAGDIEARVEVLIKARQSSMAYML